MKDSVVHDPHDKFFKESFGRKELVVPFFAARLAGIALRGNGMGECGTGGREFFR